MGAYIINVPDTVDTIIYVNIGDVYDGKTYIASQRVEDLTPYTEPDLEQVRKEAYEAGAESSAVVIADDKAHEAYKLGYENGLNDAWEAARTLWNTPNRKEIFGNTTFNTVLTTHTAQETIEKIRQYEQEKQEEDAEQDGWIPVVRCEYCKHWHNGMMGMDCAWDANYPPQKNDFCSRGVRREE